MTDNRLQRAGTKEETSTSGPLAQLAEQRAFNPLASPESAGTCEPEPLNAGISRRFNARLNRAGPVPKHAPELGQCHLWTGGKSRDGYGQFSLDGRIEGPPHPQPKRGRVVTWQTWLMLATNVGSIATFCLVCIALRRVREVEAELDRTAAELKATDKWIGLREATPDEQVARCLTDMINALIDDARLSRDVDATQPPEPEWQTWLRENGARRL